MGARPTTIHSTWWWLIAAGVALTLIMAAGASSASAALANASRVRNPDTDGTYQALQAAVDAANSGDHLSVQGTCRGGTVVDKSLVIEGVRTTRGGRAVLDGDGLAPVLTIRPRVTVSVRSLTIREGRARKGGGGGLSNDGRLTLDDVVVRGNTARSGGGVYNRGRLTLEGTTSISHNAATDTGGGVTNVGTLVMNDASSILRNGALRADGFGDLFGGGVLNGRPSRRVGTLTLNDRSRISENTAMNAGGVGNYGVLILNDSGSIRANTARHVGGVANGGGSITLT